MFLEEHQSGKLSKWAGVDHVVHPVDGAIERLMSGLRSSSLTEVIPFEADATLLSWTLHQKQAGSYIGH